MNDNNRQQQLIGINSEPIAVNGSGDMITRFKQENTVLKEKCEKLVLENKQMRMDLMRRKILENGIHSYLMSVAVVCYFAIDLSFQMMKSWRVPTKTTTRI